MDEVEVVVPSELGGKKEFTQRAQRKSTEFTEKRGFGEEGTIYRAPTPSRSVTELEIEEHRQECLCH